MTGPKLTDAISRLFDEMVRDPWSRPGRPTSAPQRADDSQLEIEVPIAGGQLGEVSIARDGPRIVVRARVRTAAGTASRGDAGDMQSLERVIIVPADAEVSGVEARYKGDVLHVRVSLRTHWGA
jgi:HSP20 family molecular chaperone IbpA